MDFAEAESGAVYIWVAGAIVALFGVGALAIDMSFFYVLRNQAQISADSAALAAVVELPDEAAAKTAALDYANRNMSTDVHGEILRSSDIVAGSWDLNTKTFVPGGAKNNALQVTIRRSEANDNEVPTFFGSVLGVTGVDVATTATAYLPLRDCFSQGIMVAGFLQLDQGTVVEDDTCLYGRDGVHFDRDGTMNQGAYVGALDKSTITYDQGFSGDPDTQFGEADPDFGLVSDVGTLIDDIEMGNYPDNITNVQVVNDFPAVLTSGTAYIIEPAVEGEELVVNVDKNYSAQDILIAVRGSIEWGQKGSIANTGDCSSGEPGIGIIATDDITLHQSSTVDGAQMISGRDFTLHQNANFKGSAIAGRNGQIDQQPSLGSCEPLFEVPPAGLNIEPRLVM